jgi:hypothetical protein
MTHRGLIYAGKSRHLSAHSLGAPPRSSFVTRSTPERPLDRILVSHDSCNVRPGSGGQPKQEMTLGTRQIE